MSRPKKYPQELIGRSVRLALESGQPIAHVARDIGLPAETLRKSVRQAEADRGFGRGCLRVRSGRRSGSQYTSTDYTQVLADHEVLASIGTVGDCYDTAL